MEWLYLLLMMVNRIHAMLFHLHLHMHVILTVDLVTHTNHYRVL